MSFASFWAVSGGVPPDLRVGFVGVWGRVIFCEADLRFEVFGSFFFKRAVKVQLVDVPQG
jgi:hypothetical protein